MTTSRATQSYVGIGVYSIADAARILHEPTGKVSRWLSDRAGLIHRYFAASERAISFAELMELHFIKMFRDEGVSLQAIRRASRTAAKRFNSDYPFSFKRFDTDGKAIFATLIHRERKTELIEDLEKGQYVINSVMRPFFHKLDYRDVDERVARFWPCGKRGRIVLDPSRKLGQPIDNETGMSVESILAAIHAGGGQKEADVAKWLDLPLAAVHAAVRFEKTMAA